MGNFRFLGMYTCLYIRRDDRVLFKYSGKPRFCRRHISGTVTCRDSKLSVLLGPAV